VRYDAEMKVYKAHKAVTDAAEAAANIKKVAAVAD
jgi:hypothetical protein